MLWSGTLGQSRFEERVDATAAAGCAGMSVFPWDCLGPDTSSAEVQRTRARDAGVRIVALDPVTTWLPEWHSPASTDGSDSERNRYTAFFASFELEDCLDAAAEIGADLVSLIEPSGRSLPVDVGVDAFGKACDLAADRDIRLQLEFMPFSGVPDLSTAWDVVRFADRPNGGLVLDTWHLFQSGSSLDLLRTIPADRIFSIQLSDGVAEPANELWNAAVHRRRLPGDGTFDLVGALAMLLESGWDGALGPEVVSDALVALDPVTAATRAADAVRALLGRLSGT